MSESFGSCSVIGPSRLKARRLRNPFLMKIADDSPRTDSYVNGLNISIVCEASFWVFTFWCVDIASFHQKIANMDWQTLKDALMYGKFVEDALYANDLDLYRDQYATLSHKVTPPPSSVLEKIRSHALSGNRSKYPLVILLVLNDNEIDQPLEGDDIVLLVSVVHLKDNVIPLETSVIASYIKRKCGTVLNLHDLFISTEIDEDNKPTCVICLTNTITLALLPCRHACLCGECFPKISQCPLCRFAIQSCIALDQPLSQSSQNDQTRLPETQQDAYQPEPEVSLFRRIKRTLFG